jgi:hypothetical protein
MASNALIPTGMGTYINIDRPVRFKATLKNKGLFRSRYKTVKVYEVLDGGYLDTSIGTLHKSNFMNIKDYYKSV